MFQPLGEYNWPEMTVYVQGLETYGYHGVPDEEQVVGHRYSINFSLEVPDLESQADSITETVDYGEASELALSVFGRAKRRTIERVATDIMDALFDIYPSVSEVTVQVEKLLPPAPIIAGRAGVTVTRCRQV